MPITPEYLQNARKEGFTDDEIYSYEATQDPFYAKAKEEGFTLDELAQYNATVSQEEEPESSASFVDVLKRVPAGIAQAGLDAASGVIKAVQDFLPDRERAADPSYQPVYDSLKASEAALNRKYEDESHTVGPFSDELKEIQRKYEEELAPIRKAREILQKNPNSALSVAAGLMRDLSERTRGDYGVDPNRDQAFLSKVASGVGSLVPVIASGPAAPITAAGMMAEGGRKDAEQMGATQEQQDRAFYANAAVGVLSEALLGIPALLRSAKAAGVPDATMKAMAKAAAVQGLKSSFREGSQEAIEQAAQNAIASYIAEYDPSRPLMKDVADAFLVGASIGGPTGSVIQTAEILSRPTDTTENKEYVEKVADQLRESGAPLTAQALETETKGGETDEQNETERIPDSAGAQQAGDAQRETERGGEVLSSPGVQVPESPVQPSGESSPRTDVPNREEVLTTEGEVPAPAPVPTQSEVPQQQESPTPELPEVGGEISHPLVGTAGIGVGVFNPSGGRKSSKLTSVTRGNDTRGGSKTITLHFEDGTELGATLIKKEDGTTATVDETVRHFFKPSEVPQQQTSETPQEPPKVLTPDDRAALLQPYLKAAQAAAEASGATDAESAVQDAWRKISNSEKPLDNPRAVLIDAARSEAKSQLSKANAQKRGGGLVEGMDVADLEEAAVETRGPRAETVAKEDIEQITKAIETLNENETRVAKVLMRGEDLSNAEIAEELGLAVGTVKNIKMKIEEVFRPYAERMGFGQSLGPGAASAAEVLTQYEVRRFSERFQKSKDIDEDVREQTGNRYYEVLPNQVTAEKAREFFEQNPDTEKVLSLIMEEKQAVSFADRAAIGQLLVKKINEERKALKTSDPEKADRLLDRVIEASEWLAEYGTRLGQGVQAFAMWNRLTPEGKLRSVQKEVQKTRKKFIRDNQKDVDAVHDILNEDTSMEVKRSKLSKSKSRTAKAAKKNLNKIPKKPTKEQLLDTLSKDLGLPTLTPEQQAEIMRLAEIAENAPEGMPKEDALNELNSYIAHIKGFHWSDLPLGIYYGNILSGAGTQVVNLVDTALNVVSEVAGSAIVGNGSKQSLSDAFGMISGLARGLDSGRWDWLLAITKGRRISDGKFVENPYLMDIARFGEEGGVPIQQTGRISSFAKKAAESKYAKYLKGYKYVGRVMAASDALAFRSAQEARAAQLAHWLAYDSGLKGQALRDEVDRILGFDRKEEFLEQAEAEGYTGATAKARATELMLQSRPEGLQKEATQFASEATYNYKPEGMMGAISNAIEGFSRTHPAVKLIVPFTRIVANVTNRGLNYTPWGAFRAWRMDSDGKTLTDQERRKQQMLYTRAVMGVSAISVIGAMAAMGFIKLHGKGPDDDEKRKQLRETGWKPYTIQIGNQYFTYTYTPIGLGLAALANSLEAKRYGTLEDKDIYTAFAYAIQSIGSTIFSQSFLSNLSSFFEALSNRGSQGVSAFKRLISSTASGLAVPFSSAVKDVNQLFDPTVRKPDNITEALISEIPVARLALKPTLNALGEPIQKDRIRLRERFMSSNREGVWKMVRETGLRIPTTGPFFMNPKEDYEYAQKTGERIKGYLERNEKFLRSKSREDAQDSLENFADRVKKEVRGEMLYKGAKKKPKK